MSTALIKAKPEQEALLFTVTEETVKPMAEKYLALKINGLNDKTGFELVKKARSEVRTARTTVDKEREAAKRFYLEEGRRIDKAAKDLWALLEPVEKHLVSQLDAIEAEKQRIEDARLDKQLQERLAALDVVGGVPATVSHTFPDDVIRTMSDDRFTDFVKQMTDLNVRLKAEREAAEKAAKEAAELAERNRIEAAKIAADRAELERQKAEAIERQRVENERIAAEQAAQQKILDDQRAAQQKESERIEAEKKKLEAATAVMPVAPPVPAPFNDVPVAEPEVSKRVYRFPSSASAFKNPDVSTRKLITDYRDALLAIERPQLPDVYRSANVDLALFHSQITVMLDRIADTI